MCWCIHSCQGSCFKSSLRQKNCGTLTTVSLFPACLSFVFLSAYMIVLWKVLGESSVAINNMIIISSSISLWLLRHWARAITSYQNMFEWKCGAWDSISHEAQLMHLLVSYMYKARFSFLCWYVKSVLPSSRQYLYITSGRITFIVFFIRRCTHMIFIDHIHIMS